MSTLIVAPEPAPIPSTIVNTSNAVYKVPAANKLDIELIVPVPKAVMLATASTTSVSPNCLVTLTGSVIV